MLKKKCNRDFECCTKLYNWITSLGCRRHRGNHRKSLASELQWKLGSWNIDSSVGIASEDRHQGDRWYKPMKNNKDFSRVERILELEEVFLVQVLHDISIIMQTRYVLNFSFNLTHKMNK